MRTDDPIILKRLEQIEAACAGLRMACGFPELHGHDDPRAKPMRYDCPHCTRMTRTQADLDEHIHIDHPEQIAA